MTDDAWMIKLAGGFTIACPPNLDTLSTYVFKEQEDWFEDEAAFIRRLATPGWGWIAIAPNLGFYALSAAAAAGGDADILAIEPTPEVAALLRAKGLEVKLDTSNQKINAKIREHSVQHVPVIAVVGRKEAEQRTVALRRLGGEAQEVLPLDEAVARLAAEAMAPDLVRGAA